MKTAALFITLSITFGLVCSLDSAKADESPRDLIGNIEYSADGSTLVTDIGRLETPPVSRSKRLEVWDARSGLSKRRFSRIYGDAVWDVALSPNGRWMVAAMSKYHGNEHLGGLWMLWDVAAGRLIRRAAVPYGGVFRVEFSPDGSAFALGSIQASPQHGYVASKVFVVETQTGKALRTHHPHFSALYSLAFSPDGRYLAVCGEKRFGKSLPERTHPPLGIVRVWNMKSGILQHTFLQPDCSLSGITFSPRSDFIVCGRDVYQASQTPPLSGSLIALPRDLILWDLNNGQSTVFEADTHTPEASVRFNQTLLKFSEDGQQIAGLMTYTTPIPGSMYSNMQTAVRTWQIPSQIASQSSS